MQLDLTGLGARLLQNRRLVRAPIWFYRHGAGWLFGRRMLLLEHVGRRSGRPRFVCLEVVEHRSPDHLVIVSGFGEQAQWYRNLRGHDRCYVSIGRRTRVPAQARFLPEEEAAATLRRYQAAHPGGWERLRGVLERAVGGPIDRLPVIELALDGPETTHSTG